MTVNKRKKRGQSSSGSRPKKAKLEKVLMNSDSVKYQGPIVLPRSLGERRPLTINVSLWKSLTSTGAGILDMVTGTNEVQSTPGWASLANDWHEYRVLGMKTHFVPSRSMAVTTVYPPIITVNDRAGGAFIGSYVAGADHESALSFSSYKPWSREIKMDGVDESPWTIVTASFTWGWTKAFATGFPATVPIGGLLITFVLSLRGKG